MSRKAPLPVALVVAGATWALGLLAGGAWLAVADEEYEATATIYVGANLDHYTAGPADYDRAAVLLGDCLDMVGDLAPGASLTTIPETTLFEITAQGSSAHGAQAAAQATAERAVRHVDDPDTGCGDAEVEVLATITDPAPLPTEPVSPDAVRTLLVAGALGLLAGVALGGFAGVVLRRRLDDVEATGTPQ